MGKVIYAVDEFGEIKEGGLYITPEEAKREEEIKQQRRDYFRRMEQQNTLRIGFEDIFGEFYFVNYRRLLTVINDNTALAFRYLYLCTFADETGKIVFKGKDVIHKNFKRILNLNPKTANADVAELEKYGLIYSIKDVYYVNLDYYIRKQKLPDDFKGNSARIIDKGVRELYEQSTPRSHAMLGKIVPLLEHINKYNNILCTKSTVTEFDHTKIIPLTGYEICRICGRTIENSDRFLKELKSFTIDRLPFIRRVVDETKYNLDCYIVNPYVVYMGSRNDQLEWTFKLFDLRSRRIR
jgi:hypothetical protein